MESNTKNQTIVDITGHLPDSAEVAAAPELPEPASIVAFYEPASSAPPALAEVAVVQQQQVLNEPVRPPANIYDLDFFRTVKAESQTTGQPSSAVRTLGRLGLTGAHIRKVVERSKAEAKFAADLLRDMHANKKNNNATPTSNTNRQHIGLPAQQSALSKAEQRWKIQPQIDNGRNIDPIA